MLEPLTGTSSSNFDATKFNWIGSGMTEFTVCALLGGSPTIKTFADATKTPITLAGSGPGSDDDMISKMLIKLLGLKAKVVSGYPGGEELHLAIERGEVNCRGADGWSSVKATDSDWLRDHKISVLVQWGIEPDPEISKVQGREVPNIVDLGKTEADRLALRLIATGNAMGRPMVAPPGVPADRVKALRGGDYVAASRGFRGFIQQYPDSPLLPNAYYWLGESYYVTMNYPVALEAFQRLLSQFPQSEKAPDAMLKLGYSQIELKQVDAGKATLKNVSAKYPGSKAAGLAQERLRRLQLQSAN